MQRIGNSELVLSLENCKTNNNKFFELRYICFYLKTILQYCTKSKVFGNKGNFSNGAYQQESYSKFEH